MSERSYGGAYHNVPRQGGSSVGINAQFHENCSKDTSTSVDAPPFFRIAGVPQVRHVHAGGRYDWTSQARRWRSPYNMPRTYTHGPRARAEHMTEPMMVERWAHDPKLDVGDMGSQYWQFESGAPRPVSAPWKVERLDTPKMWLASADVNGVVPRSRRSRGSRAPRSSQHRAPPRPRSSSAAMQRVAGGRDLRNEPRPAVSPLRPAAGLSRQVERQPPTHAAGNTLFSTRPPTQFTCHATRPPPQSAWWQGRTDAPSSSCIPV